MRLTEQQQEAVEGLMICAGTLGLDIRLLQILLHEAGHDLYEVRDVVVALDRKLREEQ